MFWIAITIIYSSWNNIYKEIMTFLIIQQSSQLLLNWILTFVVWQTINTTTIPLRSAAIVLSRLWVLEIALCRLVCLKLPKLIWFVSNLSLLLFSDLLFLFIRFLHQEEYHMNLSLNFILPFQETVFFTSGFPGIWCSWESLVRLLAEDSASGSCQTKCKDFNSTCDSSTAPFDLKPRICVTTILPRCSKKSSADSSLDWLRQFCNGAEIENPL